MELEIGVILVRRRAVEKSSGLRRHELALELPLHPSSQIRVQYLICLVLFFFFFFFLIINFFEDPHN